MVSYGAPVSAQGVAFVAAQARRSNAPTHAAMKPTSETLQLPDGRTLDLERKRWDGPLDQAEVAFCRARGIPLAFDCAQSGWVLAQSDDASSPSAAAANATAAARVVDVGVAVAVPAVRQALLAALGEACAVVEDSIVASHLRHGTAKVELRREGAVGGRRGRRRRRVTRLADSDWRVDLARATRHSAARLGSSTSSSRGVEFYASRRATHVIFLKHAEVAKDGARLVTIS